MTRHGRPDRPKKQRKDGATAESAAARAAESLDADIARALREPTSEEGLTTAAALGQGLMDGAVTVGWQGSKLRAACKEGCAYCCQGVRVAVTIAEVARAVDHARAYLEPEALAHVEERARDNAPRTHGATARGYPLRLACALLGDDGRCTVYAARPMMCRREHSLDVAQCKAGFDSDDPERDSPIDHASRVMELGDATISAFRRALSDAGTDAGYYELQEALHLVLSTPGILRAWLDGSDAFASARLDETVEDADARQDLVRLGVKP